MHCKQLPANASTAIHQAVMPLTTRNNLMKSLPLFGLALLGLTLLGPRPADTATAASARHRGACSS